MNVNIKDRTTPRGLIGRIETVDRHTDKERSRSTILIDAVDEAFDQKQLLRPASEWSDEHFAIVRVMTTYQKFSTMAGIFDRPPEDCVGMWVALSLVPKGVMSGPVAEVSVLSDGGYREQERYTVEGIESLGDDPDFPRSLGAAGNSAKQTASQLAAQGKAFSANRPSRELIQKANAALKKTPKSVLVQDVGHANFTTVRDSDRVSIAHFDVGWPISMNKRTVKGPPPQIRPAPLVILSHWDWDHLHGFYVWPALQRKIWIAPIQDLGPGALKIAKTLNDAGLLFSVPPWDGKRHAILYQGQMRIGQCNPTHAKTKAAIKNNSGLFLTVQVGLKRLALLPGDADYYAISWPHKDKPTLLVVPHHGARIEGNILPASSRGDTAVVSMGLGNVYRHPNSKVLKEYRKKGWRLHFTARWNGAPRGDRSLE